MIDSLRVLHLIERLDRYGASQPLWAFIAQHRPAEVVAWEADPQCVAELRAGGTHVTVLMRRWEVDPWAVARLTARWRQSWDLVHAWGPLATQWAARLQRFRPARWIASLAAPLPPANHSPHRLAAACRGATAVAWLDEQAASWGAAHIGSLPISATIARAAAPPPRSKSSPPGLWRAALGIQPDRRLIASAGPLVRRRALEEALWAFELVRVLVPNAMLVLAGAGPDRLRLERFARQVGEPDGVVFLGECAQWQACLADCEIYWEASPSVRTPQALWEALAAGLPVVCADVPAHRQVIVHRENGLLAKPGDRADMVRQTVALLEDRQGASALGTAAADRCRQIASPKAAGDAWRRIYEAVSQLGPL